MPTIVVKRHHTNKQRSKKSEKATAKFFSGKLQPGSGCLPVASFKGDVKSDKFLIDDKVTRNLSFSVTRQFWKKLSNEAWTLDKRAVLRINFEGGPTLLIVDELTMEELLSGEDRLA